LIENITVTPRVVNIKGTDYDIAVTPNVDEYDGVVSYKLTPPGGPDRTVTQEVLLGLIEKGGQETKVTGEKGKISVLSAEKRKKFLENFAALEKKSHDLTRALGKEGDWGKHTREQAEAIAEAIEDIKKGFDKDFGMLQTEIDSENSNKTARDAATPKVEAAEEWQGQIKASMEVQIAKDKEEYDRLKQEYDSKKAEVERLLQEYKDEPAKISGVVNPAKDAKKVLSEAAVLQFKSVSTPKEKRMDGTKDDNERKVSILLEQFDQLSNKTSLSVAETEMLKIIKEKVGKSTNLAGFNNRKTEYDAAMVAVPVPPATTKTNAQIATINGWRRDVSVAMIEVLDNWSKLVNKEAPFKFDEEITKANTKLDDVKGEIGVKLSGDLALTAKYNGLRQRLVVLEHPPTSLTDEKKQNDLLDI
jgi:hypothetical protein